MVSALRHTGTTNGRDRSRSTAAQLYKLTNSNDVATQHELLSRLALDDDPDNGIAILSTTAPSYNEQSSGTDTCLLVPLPCDTPSVSVSFDNGFDRSDQYSPEAQTTSAPSMESHLSTQDSTAIGMSTIHDAGSDSGDRPVWPATLHLRPNDQREWNAVAKMQIFSTQIAIDDFIETVAKLLKVPTHRLDLLAYDAGRHTVHIAIVIPPLEIMKLIKYDMACGMEIRNPTLMPLATYFTAMQSAPSLAFDSTGPYQGTEAHVLMTQQIATLIMTQGAHESLTPTAYGQPNAKPDNVYRDRYLLENGKALVDRMVDRLNHQLKHLLPHDPDDKQFKPLDRYEGYDDIDYSTYYGEIMNIMQDDAITTRHRLEQRRIMHDIIGKTLSTNRLIASDPLSSPKAYWDHLQNLYVEQQRRNKDGHVVNDSWLPIEQLTADDSSYYLTSETEADLNQGGVSLLQLKFPQRAVPEYLHKAVINFRCKQFLDVDQVQRQFQEQLDRLETAQEKHRRDPATEHQDLSWSGNLLLIRGKISDIAQQMSRQCNEAITTYNASPDTNGNGIANKPIKAKMDFWQQMKTHNARIWCTTPEYMWTMLKKVVDNKMIFEDEDDPSNLNQLNLKDELERRRIWTQGRSYAPVTQSSEWLKLQATHDVAMTAPTNYSYRNHQSKTRAKREDRWARPVSGAPNVHAARGRNTRKNTSAEQTKHSVMLASTGGDDKPPTFTYADSSERTFENSVAAIHMRIATPLPAAYSIDQCRESGITKALPTSRVLQLYDRDRKDTPSIKQAIETALGPKRVPLNAALMESHIKRTDESRTADYKSDRPRGSDGRVEWSEKSLAMMRAMRTRTLFQMGDLDPKTLNPLEVKFSFTEYDKLHGQVVCPFCDTMDSVASKRTTLGHGLLNCPKLKEHTSAWKPGQPLHVMYKEKWAKSHKLPPSNASKATHPGNARAVHRRVATVNSLVRQFSPQGESARPTSSGKGKQAWKSNSGRNGSKQQSFR